MNRPQKTFEGWKYVPPEYKTRNLWLRNGRKVPDRQLPTATVVFPRIVDRSACLEDSLLLEETDDFAVVSEEVIPLYHRDQTVPYTPTKRTLAYWAYEDIFFKYSQKTSWIRKTDLASGIELPSWVTEYEDKFATKYHRRNTLTVEKVHQHINQRSILGVKGGENTRFVMIDLDFHGRNHEVFLSQAEVLLDRFHGVGTWHYQIKMHEVSGIHLINVFDKPRSLTTVRSEIRQILKDLDSENPALMDEARQVGMKTLGELEIYPHENQGVRLPLCRDRTMFLDMPLPLITVNKREVQDVEVYIAWLNNPNRQYMPKEQIFDHLRYFAIPIYTPDKSILPRDVKKTVGSPVPARWKGNLKRWLYDFWIEGESNGRPLNEHIAVLARLAAVQGYSEDEIRTRIGTMIGELPATAKSCSSRLMQGKIDQVENVIKSTSKYACDRNGHQYDAHGSTEIFSAALMRWPDFDALDTTTWTAPPVHQEKVVPNWSDQQKSRLCAFFRKPLFVKDDGLIIRFLDAIVNLTITKEKQGHGWGKEYLLKWMTDHFPQIKCGNDMKRHRILRCLEEEGIITAKARGRAGMYATHWVLGKVAKQALGMADQWTEAEKPLIPTQVTSTTYSSNYSEEDFYGYEPLINIELSTIGFSEEKTSSADLVNKTENPEPQSPEQLTTVV